MSYKSKIMDILKKYTMIMVLVLTILFFTIFTNGKLLLPSNVNNLIAQNAYVFILATGMLFCILTGGNIDLSVGSGVCLVGAIGGKLMLTYNINPIIALIAMIIVGTLVGVLQGFWIAYVRVPSFIVTLAGLLIFRGLSNTILNGQTLSPIPKQFTNLFNTYVKDVFNVKGFNLTCFLVGVIVCIIYIGFNLRKRKLRKKSGLEIESFYIFFIKSLLISVATLFFMYKLALYKGIPNSLIWIAIIIIIYTYISNKTTIGRYFYALGGNEKATKLSGIDINKIYFTAYANMGFLVAIAGMVTLARLNSATPMSGTNYELDAIGACFIGGASAYGGIGTVPGVIIGATLMGVLNLGMSIMGVDQNLQKVIKGAVLLLAVIFDVVSKRKSFIER